MKTKRLPLLLPLLVLASCVTPPPTGERVVGRRPVTPRQVSDSIAQQWEGYLQDSPFSSASGNLSFIDSASQIGGTASRVSNRASNMQDARLSAHAQRVASWCQDTLQTKQQLDSQISSIQAGGELRDHIASKAGSWAFSNSEGTNTLGQLFGGLIGSAFSQAYTGSEVSSARRAAAMRVTRQALDLIEEEDALGREIGIAPTPGLERTLRSVMDMRKTMLLIGTWKGEFYPAIKGTTTHAWQFWGDGDFTCRTANGIQSGTWGIHEGRMTFRWHNGTMDIMIPEFTTESQVTMRPTRSMSYPTMVKFSDDPSQTPPLPAPGPPLNIRINL